MDKIKEFLRNRTVRIAEWCVLAAVSAALILGGTGAADLSSGIELAAGIVSAVSLLVKFIGEMADSGTD